jgi:hypothetical protein
MHNSQLCHSIWDGWSILISSFYYYTEYFKIKYTTVQKDIIYIFKDKLFFLKGDYYERVHVYTHIFLDASVLWLFGLEYWISFFYGTTVRWGVSLAFDLHKYSLLQIKTFFDL